jgi:allantoate deiminase
MNAETVMQRIETLARFSEEPDRLTRRFATDALNQANTTVAEWMTAAGMTVRRDSIGNMVGRYQATHAGAKTLLIGSHLDTVRDAGKYDGPLGVLVALACIEQLHARKERLPFALELIAFADEEGLRYGTAYLGSKAIAGTLEPHYLELTDADGITMRDAISAWGGDPAAIAHDRRNAGALLGYCEVHIEQGPVLETHSLPVGLVSAIVGQSRINVSFTGQAGHAGTVPMALRRDALCAAAEFVLAVEQCAHDQSGLVATVGQIVAQPGASNVIPGQVTLSLDVRHSNDAIRMSNCDRLRHWADKISATRQVQLSWNVLQATPSVPCDAVLTSLLAQAVADQQLEAMSLVSGAGHDAVALSEVTPVAMLFVRCKDGVSHNPAESVQTEDVALAINVVGRFLELLAEKVNRR